VACVEDRTMSKGKTALVVLLAVVLVSAVSQ
jgi:hypothetical protein